jgi:hypothetical protein
MDNFYVISLHEGVRVILFARDDGAVHLNGNAALPEAEVLNQSRNR